MIIQLENGKQLDIVDYNLKRLYHYIPSVDISHETSEIDGMDGAVFLETKFTSRTITVDFLYESRDIHDYYLLRDEINALFSRRESFYLIFKNEPYKRYKVRLASSFNVTPDEQMEAFTVNFICVGIYGESLARTSTYKEWDEGKWGWNKTVGWDKTLDYVFKTNTFAVENLGNATVDPRQHELEIKIKGNFSSYITIKNTTTGDTYTYSGSLNVENELKITGIQSFKNGTNVFRNTNKKLIRLASGKNDFVITGGTIQSISFDFRFLYL